MSALKSGFYRYGFYPKSGFWWKQKKEKEEKEKRIKTKSDENQC